MSYIVIPTDPTLLFWDQVTTLDGVPYALTFRYNTREEVYYLQIASSDGALVYAQGVKLVSNYPLLLSYGDTPPGELIALSSNPQDDSPAKLGEMGPGLRVALLYLEQADLLVNGAESWRNPNPGTFVPIPEPR